MAANVVTISRIIASLALLLFAPGSAVFWAFYCWCGFSDMIDGTIARKTKGESIAGAQLDSIADLAFSIACAIKLLPVLHFEIWLIVWVVAIALLKVFNLISNAILRGDFSYPHSITNKIVGLAVFVTIPLFFFTDQPLVAVPACAVATFAALHEYRPIQGEKKPPLHVSLQESNRIK